MSVMKKLRVSNYLLFAAIVFGIVGMVFINQSSEANPTYALGNIGTVNTLFVLSWILFAGAELVAWFCRKKFHLDIIADAMLVIGAVLTAEALIIEIDTRTTLMGYVWFSNLESGNPSAVAALTYALRSWIFTGVSLLCVCVAAFFGLGRKEEKKPVEAR